MTAVRCCPTCGHPLRKLGLTQRQYQCLDAIRRYMEAHGGKSPNYDEIVAALGVSSKGNVKRILDALEDRGHIQRLHRRARSITVL